MHNYSSILITGASRGIGAQLARSYAAPGVHLILIARDAEALRNVAQACEALGSSTVCASIDVRDAIALKTFTLTADEKNPIDLVIANAGVSSTLQHDWQQEAEETLTTVFEINIQGMLNTINPLIHRMISRQRGQFVLMSSLAGLRGLPQSPSYSSSKAAVHVYGQSLRGWLVRYGVKVNVVYPGYIDTAMSQRLHGPKPLLMSCEKAVQLIQYGVKKNKASIAFPWGLSVLTKLSMILPSKPVDFILNKFESYVKY